MAGRRRRRRRRRRRGARRREAVRGAEAGATSRPARSAPAARGIQYEFHPVTPARWNDLEKLFGPRGACAGCWCSARAARRPSTTPARATATGARSSALVGSGAPVGAARVRGGRAGGLVRGRAARRLRAARGARASWRRWTTRRCGRCPASSWRASTAAAASRCALLRAAARVRALAAARPRSRATRSTRGGKQQRRRVRVVRARARVRGARASARSRAARPTRPIMRRVRACAARRGAVRRHRRASRACLAELPPRASTTGRCSPPPRATTAARSRCSSAPRATITTAAA